MLRPALALLRCPLCASGLDLPRSDDGRERGPARCAQGHSFDVARQGHLNLLGGAGTGGLVADTADMVAARERVQSSGLFAPVTEALAEAATRTTIPAGGLLDLGGGTGHHAAAVLERDPDRVGVGVDLSAYAARRAARAHPRLASVVADVWRGLPVRDAGIAVALCVFAPRNADEIARVLAPGGLLVVVTPGPGHLAPLVEDLGLLSVDPAKEDRLAARLAALTPMDRREVSATVGLTTDRCADLVLMGPSAWHHAPEEVRGRLSNGPEERDVRIEVEVSTFRRP